MNIGKLPPRKLPSLVFRYLGSKNRNVVVGPRVGLDAAVIDVGKKMVVASDPITGAMDKVGKYVVNVNANDVAVMGATPEFFLNTILLPEGSREEDVRNVMRDIHREARKIGVAIVGGHTEISPHLKTVFLCGTMVGFASRIITAGGARPDDILVLTKGAGIEGTSILASDKYDLLKERIPQRILDSAKRYSENLSVVKEALIARTYATAMHDPTEGGVAGALHEMADASKCGFEVKVSHIKIQRETDEICSALGINPLNLIGSGALLITVPERKLDALTSALTKAKVKHFIIGKMTKRKRNLPEVTQDEIWRFV